MTSFASAFLEASDSVRHALGDMHCEACAHVEGSKSLTLSDRLYGFLSLTILSVRAVSELIKNLPFYPSTCN